MNSTWSERHDSLVVRGVRYVRETPVDVTVVLLVVALGALAVAGGWDAQAAFGAPLLLFVPGYAILLALFPAVRRSDSPPEEGFATGGRFPAGALTTGERVLVSVGVSVACMPLVGLVLAAAGLGYTPIAFLTAYVPLTVVPLLFGDARRRRIPEDRRYEPFERSVLSAARRIGGGSTTDTLLNLALILAVLGTTVGLGYALVAPNHGESYSNFYLLTQNSTGDYVASGYPTNLTRGERSGLVVGVDNHEGSKTTYTIVGELQRVRVVGNRTVIEDRQQLGSVTRTVPANGTWRGRFGFTPLLTGSDLRLTFYLYRGDAPDTPSKETADRYTYVWVDVR